MPHNNREVKPINWLSHASAETSAQSIWTIAVRVAEENLRGGFNDARFCRILSPQERDRTDRWLGGFMPARKTDKGRSSVVYGAL